MKLTGLPLALFFVSAAFSAAAQASDFSAIARILDTNASMEGREFGTEAPCFARVVRSGGLSHFIVTFVEGGQGFVDASFPYAPNESAQEAHNSQWTLHTDLARLTFEGSGQSLELRTDCSCNKVSRLRWKDESGVSRVCAFD